MRKLTNGLLIFTAVVKAVELLYLDALRLTAKLKMSEPHYEIDGNGEYVFTLEVVSDPLVVIPAVLAALMMIGGGVLFAWGMIRYLRRGATRAGLCLLGGALFCEVGTVPVFMFGVEYLPEFMFYRYFLGTELNLVQLFGMMDWYEAVKYVVLGVLIALEVVVLCLMVRNYRNKPTLVGEGESDNNFLLEITS